MNSVVFKLSPKAMVYITLFVAGLLVFVWLHWRGQRQTELVVFSVLTALAATLYTIRSEVGLSMSRELYGTRRWLGLTITKIVVRVGAEDRLYLTEDLTHNKGTQGVGVFHRLEASGQLVSHERDEPGPYIMASEAWTPNRAKLEVFAEQASKTLGVPLEDTRKFTERVKKHRDGIN